ncbi:glycosyl transferase [Salinisphaera sp. T31B1]|uniref:glycosyl transferase n=1 Tax=Salinisphaera sp. T31B1 TaxID=727963 RepID=UPI003341FFA4
MSEVSLVVTSCGRLDLLEQTMRSFLAFNRYPIRKAILVEDSADADTYARVRVDFADMFDEVLCNDPKKGQIASIDHAYAHVDTPYIFHCEDDWLFLRGGFIEESLSVLERDPSLITVWLRELWDTNKHRIERDIHYTPKGVMYRNVAVEDELDWHGFTFNPGLRRLSDYQRIQPFTAVGHEYEINKRYWELGYHAAILERGAVEHLGHRRSERKKELGQDRRRASQRLKAWWRRQRSRARPD